MRRTLLTPAVLALSLVGLAACGSDAPPVAQADDPGATAPSALPADAAATAAPSSAPSSAVTSPATPTPRATVTVTAKAAPAARNTQTVVFGVLVPGYSGTDEGLEVRFDKVDYVGGAACDAAGESETATEQSAFRACWSNVNPRTRDLPISEEADIRTLVGDDGQSFRGDELAIMYDLIGSRTPYRISPFKITTHDGTVVDLEEVGPYALGSPDEVLARAAR